MIRVNSQSFSLSSTLQRKKTDDQNNVIKQSFAVPYPADSTSDSLRLHYVTERILASVLPQKDSVASLLNNKEPLTNGYTNGGSSSVDVAQDKYEKELILMLEQKHGKDYKMFDLTSCIATITLEKLCELCKHIDSWLGMGREKVVVLQDRGDKQRLGAAISAYLEYLNICSTNIPKRNGYQNEDLKAHNTIAKNWLDLDIFSMKKFLDDIIGPLRVPSYRRYLNYFTGLLSGKIKINSAPLYLKYINVKSPPSWLHYDSITSQDAEWKSFIKIYEGLRCIFTSDIHVIPISTKQFIYNVGNLRLRGDITIRCYQIIPNERVYEERRELIFSTQFHTCAIANRELTLHRDELDYACNDPRFPTDHEIIMHFLTTLTNPNENGYVLQSPLVRTEPPNAVARYNSLEEFNDGSLHTQGPLDGSLYATILKSPKSPTATHKTIFDQIQVNSNYSTSPQPSNKSPGVISPPAEFRSSTNKLINIDRSSQETVPNSGRQSTVSTKTDYSTSTSSNYAQIKISPDPPPRDSSLYTTTDVYRSTSAQNNYPDQLVRYNRAQSYTPNPSVYPSTSHPIKIIESYHYPAKNSNNNEPPNYYNNPRSPMTLSMDSGISSSGFINRRNQGSSLSPCSFPNQSSPRDERHQELDDILSDMLSTVQNIPDIERKNNNSTLRSSISSQSTISNQKQQHPTYTESLNSFKRSQSNSTNLSNRDRLDIYDTSSTATTLTPTPSECGRDTPIIQVSLHQTNNNNLDTIRNKRDIKYNNNDIIMELENQKQSSSYPQPGRSDLISASEDEENIPYHAREDSRPFTYGNAVNVQLSPTPTRKLLTNDPTMIKMQPGLSSPQLVRKTLGQQPIRSTTPRNDFEELLRERREKILNSKSNIGDNTPSGTSDKSFDFNNSYKSESKWNYTPSLSPSPVIQRNDNYRYEPLKRSNTMEGILKRSQSSDGTNGQSWLQLQQQRLRAKKEQNKRDDSNYVERIIHTEIINQPYRRGNAHRFDGYTSDSGAFVDDVDYYRQPLHVQTQSGPNRNYHTITTRTTVKQGNERPFVAVRRAYQQAKQQHGSAPVSPLSLLSASPNGHITKAQSNQNGLLSFVDGTASKSDGHAKLVREGSFSSNRSETEIETSITGGSPRPETPAFPVTPRTPFSMFNGRASPALPPKSPTLQRRLMGQLNNSTWSLRSQKSSASTYDWSKDLYTGNQQFNEYVSSNETRYLTRRNSNLSNANSEPQEVAPHHVKFAKDSSKYWYNPTISRDEAVALLRNAPPGTFIVRDSTTFAKAYGLVLKVAYPPAGVQNKGPPGDELVRHFLVEPTTRGVRLKGCANEPVFTSLSALVYQHSITPLALPCRLIIPEWDLLSNNSTSSEQQQLETHGAACKVLYLFTCGMESLTGPEAIRKAVSVLFMHKPLPKPTQVHFKVSKQGITLTDHTRQLFFRKHYQSSNITYCGIDPEHRTWSIPNNGGEIPVINKSIFAFVARKSAATTDNLCHVFCELEQNQPASAITTFTNKAIPNSATQDHAYNI